MIEEDPHIMDYEMTVRVLRNLLVGDMNDRSFDGTETPIVREAVADWNLENANLLLEAITPEFYEESLEAYKKEMDWHQGKFAKTFPMVLLDDAIRKRLSFAFVFLPKIIGRNEAFDWMKFYLENYWEDEVTVNNLR